jgi:hypothetical protein
MGANRSGKNAATRRKRRLKNEKTRAKAEAKTARPGK